MPVCFIPGFGVPCFIPGQVAFILVPVVEVRRILVLFLVEDVLAGFFLPTDDPQGKSPGILEEPHVALELHLNVFHELCGQPAPLKNR